jgi:hypothetical protein
MAPQSVFLVASIFLTHKFIPLILFQTENPILSNNLEVFMKKLVATAVVVCLLLITANMAQAVWLEANNCTVKRVSNAFYFAGNIGNVNLSNVEFAYFELSGCMGGKSFYGTFCVAHPELGIVKSVGCHYVPPAVYKGWVEALITAKLQVRQISVSGEASSASAGITKPVSFTFF